MSFSVVTVDYHTLPSALLDLAKDHLRIDFPDDDRTVTRCLRGAISQFERHTGQSIFAAEYDWRPVESGAAAAASYQCPSQPVASFTLSSGGVDMSAQYELRTAAPTQRVWLDNKAGEAFHADAITLLKVGFADPATLHPAIEDCVLRLAAKLYEFRETASADSVYLDPQWASDFFVGLWIPRA